jgi:hypothetical protein
VSGLIHDERLQETKFQALRHALREGTLGALGAAKPIPSGVAGVTLQHGCRRDAKQSTCMTASSLHRSDGFEFTPERRDTRARGSCLRAEHEVNFADMVLLCRLHSVAGL